MRTNKFLLLLLAAPVLASSWFGSDEESAASKWTAEQYEAAQKSFQGLKESAFDTWSDSRLREFLLEQGIVAPSGPRESLVLAAKGQYKAYTDAASSLAHQATATVDSAASQASSYAAQATAEAFRQADLGRDYVYSSWDDSKLKEYLVKKGLMKSKEQKKRDEMLAMMRNAYTSTTDPVWKAWSDSYIVRYPRTPLARRVNDILHLALVAHRAWHHQIRLREEPRRAPFEDERLLLQCVGYGMVKVVRERHEAVAR
jgi:hypothetical protein